MNAWEPIGSYREEAGAAPFDVIRPPDGAPSTPLVFASPHSGRLYPAPLMAATRLDAAGIRRSEDAHVDRLIAAAPALGARLIAARVARAYVDVNREPWDLDPDMFADELPAYARSRSARVAAGLGSIARVVREGEEIYARKLLFAEARTRVEAIHIPYHAALAGLLREAREAHGVAVLIDWHSMPAAAARGSGDIILGDRFGGSCTPAMCAAVEQAFKSLGYRVTRNSPYAGGYTTEHYGRPSQKLQALQIEVNRALYVDETSLELTPGFDRLRADLEKVIRRLAAEDWTRL